jgi:lysophospholipase L1-like esterase
VTFLDIGAKFLTADGLITKDIMPDFLHPNEKGYRIWADAIEATVTRLMR